ncbi:MAG TPA: aldo/keto reductase [Tepidisphaeraceae bacterium]|jgi:predicted aldo/keto reductase-like oxidoreductase|nr:aldo/keto reductase [Tepidisphaeraceae bacterium]
MNPSHLSRRGFLQTSAALATATALTSSTLATPPKRTAADQVPLNKTGLTISRVGIGTGSNNGHVQADIGKPAFIKLIRYAHDQGLTYIDNAKNYVTFDWIADAIAGLPREKVFLQSKVWGIPTDTLATIDSFRSVYKTDYIDSLLVHCMTKPGWTDDHKRMMDGFKQAQDKKWIRAKGVSCHTLPALKESNQTDWTDVHLVRVNPMGVFMDADAPTEQWGKNAVPIDPILAEIKSMHDKGRGVIGMKICGNGTFTNPADREKSIRFAMNNPNIDAIVIGMKSIAEVDENIAVINRALAAA